jgi:hypothetical protein
MSKSQIDEGFSYCDGVYEQVPTYVLHPNIFFENDAWMCFQQIAGRTV